MATRRDTGAGQLTFTEPPRAGNASTVKLTRAASVGESVALPQLLDRESLAAETGLARSAIDVIFRHCPVVSLPGHRKVYLRRQDLSVYSEEGRLGPQTLRRTR